MSQEVENSPISPLHLQIKLFCWIAEQCPQQVILKAGLFVELCLLMLNALQKKEAGQVLSEAELMSGKKTFSFLLL